MSEENSEKPFSVDRAKQGRASCKGCKEKCLKGELRLAKLVPSPYGEGKMKSWYHVDCIFEQFLKQRATTKRMDSADDLEGFQLLSVEDQQEISTKFQECEKRIAQKYNLDYKFKEFVKTTSEDEDNGPSTSSSSPTKKKSPKKQADKELKQTNKKQTNNSKQTNNLNQTNSLNQTNNLNETNNLKETNKDLFREFRRLVANITNVSSYTEKTRTIKELFFNDAGFHGDITLWCRFLLPAMHKRIYNLQSRQLIKLFSRIFNASNEDMLEHLEQGDVADTIQHFFEQNKKCRPAKKSLTTLQEVDQFLEQLSKLTREEDQIGHIKPFIAKCTGNDLKMIVRLIKHDLRMNAGAKHVLEAIHPEAYGMYQSSRDLKGVIDRCLAPKQADKTGKQTDKTGIGRSIMIMTPVLPMLAEACKSIEQAMKKCPNGMYSEIKYDGERVQVHKNGNEFRYFSRSLKPVLAHKVKHFETYIPQAFPHGKNLILDSEILMVDLKDGKPLPFGTLGKHKQSGLQDASVCLFIFDCIYYNGDDLTQKPLDERKAILKDNMVEIKNHIMFSEMKHITQAQDLAQMITKVLKMGLEGLVLKDIKSVYEPGKRHWLKVKKDYLFDGALADSADLIVLGAWFGTGKKGGLMSVFLMGVFDENEGVFKTVTKVHTGHDDETLEKLQKQLKMTKISGDVSKVPNWLKCTKTMVPDFVALDPYKQPVWEITGAEFTQQHDVHTANGISIRFPRVTKIRDDKGWKEATSLAELTKLFATSKENFDGSLFDKELQVLSPKRKRNETDEPSSSGSHLSKKIKLVQPLPDVFRDVRLSLLEGNIEDDNEADIKKLLRVFIAYGGTLLKQKQDLNISSTVEETATHVLHNSDSTQVEVKSSLFTNETFHVTFPWLRACIKEKSLVDVGPYLVKLLPS